MTITQYSINIISRQTREHSHSCHTTPNASTTRLFIVIDRWREDPSTSSSGTRLSWVCCSARLPTRVRERWWSSILSITQLTSRANASKESNHTLWLFSRKRTRLSQNLPLRTKKSLELRSLGRWKRRSVWFASTHTSSQAQGRCHTSSPLAKSKWCCRYPAYVSIPVRQEGLRRECTQS